MTLLECIAAAKEATEHYKAPEKNIEQYTQDEISNLAISEVMKSEILIYCSIIIAKNNSIIKGFFKRALKDFINIYGKK